MNYTNLSKQLAEFLSGKDIIREIKSSSRIISYAANSDLPYPFNPQNQVKAFNNLFYLAKPAEEFSFTAAGELTSLNENGTGRWTAIDKKIKELQQKIITNWENTGLRVPLFTGGMKFTIEHNDPDWKDFGDSNWVIPEIILLSDKGVNSIIYNFYFTRNSSISEITGNFEQKLNKLFSSGIAGNSGAFRIYSENGQSPKDKKKWKNMIHKALESIQEKGISKIVLSRKVEIMLNSEPAFNRIIEELSGKYPDCGIFLFKNNSSVFFGATPEKLFSFRNRRVTVDALAGSAGDPSILFSEKNVREHNLVIDFIKNNLLPKSINLELIRFHNTKKLNNILHIWSEISAELKDGNSIFLTLKDLFPTPAVCGVPKDTAMNLIKKLEDHRRGLYSGIIGWFNFTDADFYVAIRSGLYTGKKIIAYAGCGIVDGSDADEEFAETELKLIPILSLFKNENKNKLQYIMG